MTLNSKIVIQYGTVLLIFSFITIDISECNLYETTENPDIDLKSTVHINRGAARQMYGSGSLRQAGSNPIFYNPNHPTTVSNILNSTIQSPLYPGILQSSPYNKMRIDQYDHPPHPFNYPDHDPGIIPMVHHIDRQMKSNQNGEHSAHYEVPSYRSGLSNGANGIARSNSNRNTGINPMGRGGGMKYGGRFDHHGQGRYGSYLPDRGGLDSRYGNIPHPVQIDIFHNGHQQHMQDEEDIVDDGDAAEHRCGGSCFRGEFMCVESCTCIKSRLRCNGEINCDNSEDELGCGEGKILDDKCDELATNIRCPTSGKCILKEWLCDGDDDCGDYSDETHCGSALNCTSDQFECANGLCIQQSWVCDNDNDCKDFSDEFNCTKAECKSSEFQCNDGSCISMNWKCDQEPDCGDGSDETECAEMEPPSCSDGEFQCSYAATAHRRCVRIKFRCDGDNDCGDWSDEVGCEEKARECGVGEFKCDDKCIPEKLRCDREQDCPDGEDELHCTNVTQRTCSGDEFTCNNGNCIMKTWVCDEVPDCPTGEDEQKCEIICDENHFTCSSILSNDTSMVQPFCVNRKHVCDGLKDCPQGDDEQNCPTRKECDPDSKCEQVCITWPEGKDACSCRAGYNLASDGYSCVDIDECLYATDPVCSQTCNNTIGSFICGCMTGYILRPDLRTCKADGAPPTLLFANRVDIRQVALSNSKYISVIKGLHNAIALDYHYKKDIVFWSDVSKDVIRKAFMNGTNATDVIKWGLESPGGVAVDWIHDLIFWTDSGSKRIDVATLDGTHRYGIISNDLDKPRAIAVHPGDAAVFWTDWGPNPKIERADMDGSNRYSLVVDGIFWPNGLTLDYTAGKLYWADAKHHVIEACKFDGKDRKKIISKGLPHPFAITIFEDYLYWTDWNTKAISSANKATGSGFQTIHSGLHFPMDIHSYHPQRQPYYPNHCGTNNGGCSHLCLPNHITYSCICPLGQKLSQDKKNCQAPEKLILFARKKDLRLRQFDKTKGTSIDIVIPLEGVKSAVALAWDSNTDSIFWTDVDKDSINRAHINGTNQKAIITTNLISPAGLALDWVTNKLYWTDAGTNRIEVSNTDGTMRTLLVWEGLDKPRDIVVDPTFNGGYMYWSDWGEIPKIEKAAMDGTMRSTLFAKNLTWPNGLAIDHIQEKLFWADGGTKVIECANLDGTGRKIIIGTNLKHPFGLDIFGNKIFWTDWESSSIQSAHKTTGANRTVLGTDIKGLMDVCIFHRTRPKVKSPCEIKNGGCSHLCLLRPKGYSCACPMGIKLAEDKKSCSNGPINYLIFAHRVDIRQISLDVEYIVDVVLPLPPMKNALAVDVDRKTGEIYWTDTAEDVIKKASPNGKTVSIVVYDAIETPDGIVIDSTGRKIYWTDAGRNSIEVAELDGSNRKVLIWQELDSPRAITLHYHHGVMFWSDWGATPRIECAHMDGSNRKTIISEGLVWPNGLAIDRPSGRLYWNDANQKTIESSDLDGHNRKIIVTDVKHPYGLVVVGNHMYWTDWQTESVHRADKINGSDRTTIRDKLDGLMDIRSVQVENIAENACGVNNGGCSHLCLRNPTSYTCACPTGILHKPDSQTECQDQPSKYLLFATRSALARVSLDTRELWDVTLPIENIYNAIAVDFHWEQKLIIFTDVQLRVIRSVNMFNYSQTHTIVSTNLTTPDGIAVDWIAHNLYWTDTGRKVLEVAKLDGSSRKILIKDGLDEPRSVALYPKRGFLYWTDWSDHRPKIERSMLDGSSRRIIISSDLGFPNGLTLDYASRRLYWSDALRDRIETSDLHGQNRIHLVPDATHPFGLAQYLEHIYWTDWYKKSIIRADKATGKNKVVIRTDLDGVMEIKAVSPERQLGWNPCAIENGYCSHLCLFRQDGYVCGCPDEPDKKQPCSTQPKKIVPNKRPKGGPEEEADIDYDDPLDHFIPMHNSNYNDTGHDLKVHKKAASNISTLVILLTIFLLLVILIGVVAVIIAMMFNKRKVQQKNMGSSRSMRTFANPNYFNSSSDNNLNGVQVVEKKGFSWKRIKYDKSTERVYELEKVHASTPEYACLIQDVIQPNGSSERRFSPPPTPPHRIDSIPLQTIG